MAKISANGAHKVSEYRKTGPSEYSANTVDHVLVACSDGRILLRSTFHFNYGHTSRGGFTVQARIKKAELANLTEIADRYADRRGFTKV
jgi:hypothetical protein